MQPGARHPAALTACGEVVVRIPNLFQRGLALCKRCTVLAINSSLLAIACSPSARERATANAAQELIEQSSLPRCTVTTAPDSGWQSVQLQEVRATMRLPRTARPAAGAAFGSWIFDGGSAGYSIRERDEAQVGEVLSDSAAASRGWCLERGATRSFIVQVSRGHSPAGIGIYLQAVWALENGRELVVVGFTESDSAAALMGMARSVRF